MGFTSKKASDVLAYYIKNSHYIGLFTAKPTESTNGTVTFSEVPTSGTGYARAAIGTVNTSVSAQIANSAIIYFPETLADWGTITHFGLFESSGASQPYFWGELSNPVPVTGVDYANGITYVPIFRAHAMIIGLDKDELDTKY